MQLTKDSSADLLDPGLAAIADLVYRECGLVISSSKLAMVRSRLRGRLTTLELPDFGAYCDLVSSESGEAERAEMIAALTTNVSSFFREPHHFDKLRGDVLPRLAANLRSGKRVRFWSAGCSIGAEPYSLAMECVSFDQAFQNGDFRILATDIDPYVLNTSRKGQYTKNQMSGVSEEKQARFFSKVDPETWEISPHLRDLVRCNQLNLLKPWPISGKFDVIFCRNVVIYFDRETQEKLWPRFSAALQPDGCLFVGHSERIVDPEQFGFATFGTTGYARNGTLTHYESTTNTG